MVVCGTRETHHCFHSTAKVLKDLDNVNFPGFSRTGSDSQDLKIAHGFLFSLQKEAVLLLQEGWAGTSSRVWSSDCRASLQTLFSLGHLIFSQDSTNHPGLSAQGLPLGKHFWTNLTLAAPLLFSHPLALGFVAAPACKAAITDVFVKLRRHKADVLRTLPEDP